MWTMASFGPGRRRRRRLMAGRGCSRMPGLVVVQKPAIRGDVHLGLCGVGMGDRRGWIGPGGVAVQADAEEVMALEVERALGQVSDGSPAGIGLLEMSGRPMARFHFAWRMGTGATGQGGARLTGLIHVHVFAGRVVIEVLVGHVRASVAGAKT